MPDTRAKSAYARQPTRRTQILLWCLAPSLALIVRLVHVWQMRGTPFFDVLMGDANGYDQWAQRIAAGDWLGSEVFYQAPLYPYFLGAIYAVAGRDLLVVRIIQAVVGSASCALLGMAAARFFSPRIGLATGLALALWAPAIFFDGLLQKSVLDMFFVCATLFVISRLDGRGSWFVLGVVLGLLALTRENAIVFVLVLVIWAIGSTRRLGGGPGGWLRPLAPLAAGLVLVLLPVAARNYSVDGGLHLTTSQFGPNFYIGNNPAADGTYASIRFGRGSPEFERTDATEVAEASVGRPLSAAEVSSFWTGRALGYITAQPLDWLQLMGRKTLLLINRNEMLDTESQESYAAISWPLRLLGPVGHFGILVPLAVLGVMVARRPPRHAGANAAAARQRLWLALALMLAYAATVVMFYVFARYRYPLVPFLLLFAVPGVFSIRQALHSWTVIGTVAAVAVAANLPLLSPTLMQAITENNLGTALHERQRYDEAIGHHRRAIQLAPGYAPAHNNLGAALRGSGRIDEAIASYRKALELQPEFPSAEFNLANALLASGDAAASVAQFHEAIQRSPQSVEAHNNLGIALAAKGDVAGAIQAFRSALSIDADSALAHRNLGNVLIDSGNRAEGITHLERAIALAPSSPDALYDLGTVLLDSQEFAGAAARFAAAITLRPDWPEAYNNLGIALASQGRLAEALAHFEKAVQLKPELADARANRDQARRALKQ